MKSSAFASFCAAWVVVFALVMQMIAAGMPDGRAKGLADLGAALGQPGFLCLHHADGSGPAQIPGKSGDPCWTCPFCQLAHHAGALLPVSTLVAIRTVIVFRWLFPAWDGAASRRIPLRGQSRAPPLRA